MKAQDVSKSRKPAVNLTLSTDAVKKGNKLKKALVRGSLSSVVEFLIVREHETVFAARKGEVVP